MSLQAIRHGTHGAYTNDGCRCSECRQANREYYREYRRKQRAANPPTTRLPEAPRPRADLQGSLTVRLLSDGSRSFSCRIYNRGQREHFTIGYERDGWTKGAAQEVCRAIARDILTGRWQLPQRPVRVAPTDDERSRAPDAAEAYSLIRKAAQHLDALCSQTRSATVRLAARRALTSLYESEDATGEALRHATSL